LLRFKVHQLELGGRHYLLLPKLNARQVDILGQRLEGLGFSVHQGELLRAKSKQGTVTVSPAGFSWSTFDPSDTVLPAIPNLLSVAKERISLDALKGRYLRVQGSPGASTVHLSLRLESSPLWEKLRASGECGLAPDEHTLASFLIRRVEGRCGLITDFPADDPTPHLFGRKRYFESMLEPEEAASTLRVAGGRGARNSYVVRGGAIRLRGLLSLARRDWLDWFAELGEWCFFTPN